MQLYATSDTDAAAIFNSQGAVSRLPQLRSTATDYFYNSLRPWYNAKYYWMLLLVVYIYLFEDINK